MGISKEEGNFICGSNNLQHNGGECVIRIQEGTFDKWGYHSFVGQRLYHSCTTMMLGSSGVCN